jgi:hypothetical protein
VIRILLIDKLLNNTENEYLKNTLNLLINKTMKKRLLAFLKYLELETSIIFDTDLSMAPSKYLDSENNPCRLDGIIIKNRPFFLTISSSKKNKMIKGLVIFCFIEDHYNEARDVQMRLQSVCPTIPVLFLNSIYDFNSVKIDSILTQYFPK